MNTVIETNRRKIPLEETRFREHRPPDPNLGNGGVAAPSATQWSWACRKVEPVPLDPLEITGQAIPLPGDLAVVRVQKAGFHKYLTTAENRRLRLYPGAQFVGVFGNRYASDAYEAEVEGTGNLSLLTGTGMIGTVKSKHEVMGEPTRLSLIGFVRATEEARLNLKSRLFRPTTARRLPRNLLCVVGTGMNSGKTTAA